MTHGVVSLVGASDAQTMHALWSVATKGGSVLSVTLTERRIQHMSVVVDVLADICDDGTDRGKQYVSTDELFP